MSQLTPLQLAALQLALNHAEPGIIFINEVEPSLALDNIIARLEEINSVVSARFVPAAGIAEPSLKAAIEQTDFNQKRLVAEAGKCYTFGIEEIKRHLSD